MELWKKNLLGNCISAWLVAVHECEGLDFEIFKRERPSTNEEVVRALVRVGKKTYDRLISYGITQDEAWACRTVLPGIVLGAAEVIRTSGDHIDAFDDGLHETVAREIFMYALALRDLYAEVEDSN